jgi:large subunit ribosomal protein L1
MPNPKTGTVVGPEQIGEAVREVKGGRIDFKVEKAGIIQVSIGKASMEAPHLKANLLALMELIVKLKPSTAKGTYVRSVSVSSTMGPGVRIDPNEVVRLSEDVR